MKSTLSTLGLVLILSALIVSGCVQATAQPTEVPTDTRTGEAVAAPEGVRDALDAVLAYLSANYGDEAPAPGLIWMGENITPGWPEAPVPGWVEYQYTAEGWVVAIGHAVLPREWTIYRVTVTNPTTGFQWEGEVDAAGQAAELLAPEEVRTACAMALGYTSHHYGEQADPGRGVVWMEERTTPEGLVGSETYEFTTGDWVVTISYPVVAPENVVYQVVMANQATGFQWEGDVDAAWQVTETLAPSDVQPVVQPPDPGRALDAALAYVSKHYDEQAPAAGLAWTGDRPPPEEFVGGETFEFTSEPTDWVVTVSVSVVAPEDVVYQVVVTNESTGFRWEGEVDAAGQVTEQPAPITGQSVVGWLGHIVSDARYGDYLVLQSEGAGEVGLAGADTEIESTIMALRDTRGVGEYVHVWGTLTCGMDDHNGCQIVVTRLGYGRMVSNLDPVEGWEGTLTSGTFNMGLGNVIVPAGDFPVGYSIDSLDPTLAAQLAGLRDTGTTVRVWGQVTCGVLTLYGAEIQVTRLEIVGEPPAPVPPPGPSPTPVASWTEPVVDWWGEIVSNSPGSQHDDYFQRQIVDGGQYGIESRDPEIQAHIVALRDTGTTVHVWGTLYHDVPDVNATQILVTRLEVQEIPTPPPITEETVEGWVGTIVKYPLGFQCDGYFERHDGQRFGIEAMSADAAVRQQIEQYRWTGAQVQVWGKLVTGIPDVENRQMQVERIEALSGPAEEARNLMPFATSSASSHLPTDRGGQYQSWMAMDGSLETSWVEGVAGSGVGEWFMLTFPGTVEIYYINIDVGYDRDAGMFYANNRIKRVTFVFSSGEQIEMPLADTRGMQMIALTRAPGPNIETTFVKVVIAEVYPGSRHDDTCLAEIEVWGKAK